MAGERLENFRPEQDSNPVLWDAAAVLCQLRYKANWELAVIRFSFKPIDIVDTVKYDVMNI